MSRSGVLAGPVVGESVDVFLFANPAPQVGTWAITNTRETGWYWNSSGAQNDAGTWTFQAPAGTYDLSYNRWTGPNEAIHTLKIDGTSIGTIDSYVASGVANVSAALTGITIATSGTHTLQILAATKNASSGKYQLQPIRAVLTRRS